MIRRWAFFACLFLLSPIYDSFFSKPLFFFFSRFRYLLLLLFINCFFLICLPGTLIVYYALAQSSSLLKLSLLFFLKLSMLRTYFFYDDLVRLPVSSFRRYASYGRSRRVLCFDVCMVCGDTIPFIPYILPFVGLSIFNLQLLVSFSLFPF